MEGLLPARFNGDFNVDLAIGTPHRSSGEGELGGMVTIYYGPFGPGVGARSGFQQAVPMGVSSGADALAGSSLAVGDFNGDGYDDLAIGAPGETVSDLADPPKEEKQAGAVYVLYGASGGLDTEETLPEQVWNQDSSSIAGLAEAGDSFGQSLAAGDLNGDGRDDLAIGVPGEDLGRRKPDAGYVNVIYGKASGLKKKNDQGWHQNTSGVAGKAKPYDMFGYALAIGDVDADGAADLAIG